MTNTQRKQLFAIARKAGIDAKEFAKGFFNDIESINDLSDLDAAIVIIEIKEEVKKRTPKAVVDMRKKIIFLACECGYVYRSIMDWERFNAFMLEKSYLKKPLNEYSQKELPKLVSQFERMRDNNHKAKFNQHLTESLDELGIKRSKAYGKAND